MTLLQYQVCFKTSRKHWEISGCEKMVGTTKDEIGLPTIIGKQMLSRIIVDRLTELLTSYWLGRILTSQAQLAILWNWMSCMGFWYCIWGLTMIYFYIMGQLKRTKNMRFDFHMSLSDRWVIGRDCLDPSEHAWLIALIDFSGNWIDHW